MARYAKRESLTTFIFVGGSVLQIAGRWWRTSHELRMGWQGNRVQGVGQPCLHLLQC